MHAHAVTRTPYACILYTYTGAHACMCPETHATRMHVMYVLGCACITCLTRTLHGCILRTYIGANLCTCLYTHATRMHMQHIHRCPFMHVPYTHATRMQTTHIRRCLSVYVPRARTPQGCILHTYVGAHASRARTYLPLQGVLRSMLVSIHASTRTRAARVSHKYRRTFTPLHARHTSTHKYTGVHVHTHTSHA